MYLHVFLVFLSPLFGFSQLTCRHTYIQEIPAQFNIILDEKDSAFSPMFTNNASGIGLVQGIANIESLTASNAGSIVIPEGHLNVGHHFWTAF